MYVIFYLHIYLYTYLLTCIPLSVYFCTHALVAVDKGMQAVKLCTSKILQFLTGGAGYRRLTCIIAVRR